MAGLTEAEESSITGTTDKLILTEDEFGIKPYSGAKTSNTNGLESCSWRGIEDPFGNFYEFQRLIIIIFRLLEQFLLLMDMFNI